MTCKNPLQNSTFLFFSPGILKVNVLDCLECDSDFSPSYRKYKYAVFPVIYIDKFPINLKSA